MFSVHLNLFTQEIRSLDSHTYSIFWCLFPLGLCFILLAIKNNNNTINSLKTNSFFFLQKFNFEP